MSQRTISVNVSPLTIKINFDTVRTNDVVPGYIAFEGDGTTTEVPLGAIAHENSVIVFKNTRLAVRGAAIDGGEYILGPLLDRIIFHSPLTGGQYKDYVHAFFIKA